MDLETCSDGLPGHRVGSLLLLTPAQGAFRAWSKEGPNFTLHLTQER